MSNFCIKEISEKEFDRCVAVIRKGFATIAEEFSLTQENCPTHGAFFTLDRLKNDYAKGNRMYALCTQDDIVGFFQLVKISDEEYELKTLTVIPEYRHTGGGALMLETAKQKAKELCAKVLTLSIIEENTRLRRWYEANGFTHTEAKKFDHLPFTAGYMRVSLE